MNGEVMTEENLPVLGGRDLEDAILEAERNIDFIKRAKLVTFKVTNPNDWIDQNGKPYLQASGAEKIGRVFGISWRIDEPTLTNEESGHYSYTYKGYFTLKSATIEVIGSRGTKDPFFSKAHGADKPISEIDRNDVKKAALTNLIGNGVTRLLGMRNLTWEELETGGIKRGTTGKVDYAKKEMSEEGKDYRKKIGDMLMDMASGDKEVAAAYLFTHTSFVDKDGKTVAGKSSLNDLTEKALPVVYGKIKNAYKEWIKNTKEAENEPA